MLGYEKSLMLDPYELRVGMIADALYSVDTEIAIDTKFKLKDNEEKRIERILDCFYSVDRNFLEKKFRKKTNYIDECKTNLKKQYGIKGRQTLVNYLDKSMSGQESEKLYRVLDVYNFFEKTNKNYKTLSEALLDYYRLSDTEMENDGDIEYLKEYYKKSFKLIFKYRYLLNKNGVLALDICKAVDIAKKGYICSYLTYDLVMEYIEGFGSVLVKEFTCWRDFYKSLILGFILEDFVKNPDLEYLSEEFDEKIRRMDLALDMEITPCKYIKFRENPREEIDELLRLIYNMDINEELDIINKKMSIFIEEESLSFKEIKVKEIEEVLKQNEVLEFEDEEYLLFAYPRKMFEDKKFKLSKYNSIFITNKRMIIFNKSKKDINNIEFRIEDMNIQKIQMKSKDLYYDEKMIFEDFAKNKTDIGILQFYFREFIFKLKFES